MSAVGESGTAPVESAVPLVNQPENTLIVNEVDIPDDGGFPAPEAEEAPAAIAEGTEAAPEPPKFKKTAFQARIDTLTREREESKRRETDALKQVELYRAMAEGRAVPEGEGAPVAPQPQGLIPGTPEFTRAVLAEATKMAAVDAAKARTAGIMKAGASAYPDFNDRCNVVADLGAGDRADFMQIVTDPDVISDGHKVIAQLAENPEEAARILALPTVQMTAALVKFQAEANKAPVAKPISLAPAPIKPIDGTARADSDPKDSDPMRTYADKWQANRAAKKARGARF